MENAGIVGFGEFIQKDSSLSVLELFQKASWQALESAGLEMSQVDGLVTTSLVGTFEDPPFRGFWPDQVAHFLGVTPKILEYEELGGPSYEKFIFKAVSAIRLGLANTVLCVGGGKGSVRKKKALPPGLLANNWFSELSYCVDFKPTSEYAILANLHAHRYGTSDEERMKLAVIQRNNGMRNPKSLFKNSIDVEDVRSSPIIASPLHLLEIVPVMDGAHAFIVTNRLGNTRNQPIYLVGAGEAHDPSFLPEREDLLDLPMEKSIARAFSSTRDSIRKPNLDFVQLYDSYTITTLLELEALGLCEKGKVGQFIDETDFSIDGDLPLNTGGGSLNVGQTAYMSGGVILAEAVRQLMGKAETHQVRNARLGLVNGVGGNDTINHSITLLLSNKS